MDKIKYKFKRGLTISQIATLLNQAIESNSQCYEEIQAYGAPSECYNLVEKGFKKRLRQLSRHIGMSISCAVNIIAKRTSKKYAFKHFSSLI